MWLIVYMGWAWSHAFQFVKFKGRDEIAFSLEWRQKKEEALDMDHEHCDSCIMAHCTEEGSCNVEWCPNGCGFSMHGCKLIEHDAYTCPEALVPCTNAAYGCEELLPRRQLRTHIEHCPASAIMCSFSHDRVEVVRPVLVSATAPPTQTNSMETDGDRELLIDEKLLQGDLVVCERHHVSIADADNGSERTSYTETDVKEIYSAEENGPLNALALSVECTPGAITNLSWKVAKGMRTKSKAFRERTCINTTSSIKLHFRGGPPIKRYCCTFCCNEIVRRDEFSAHWKNLHLDIQIDMPVMVRRCPLHSYGCTHGELALVPLPMGSSLNYDLAADTTLLKLPAVIQEEDVGGASNHSDYAAKIRQKQELALYGYEDDSEESCDVLGQLPAEVLETICEHLDSLSLWYLSQVNQYLRSVCYNLVKKKGVVYTPWVRDDSSGCWTSGPKVRHPLKSLVYKRF